MLTPQTLTSDGTLALPLAPGKLAILATGSADSTLLVEVSPDGEDFVSANPDGVATLINVPFHLEMAAGFIYRLNNTNDEGDITVALSNL